MTEPRLRTITQNATLDNLSDGDYRDIYDELRAGVSLAAFVDMIASVYSRAQWSKYERGETTLNRTMRDELRVAVDMDKLPPTVASAMSAVSPDAHVVQVGDGVPNQVVLRDSSGPQARIVMNGGVELASDRRVTEVTRARRRNISIPHDVFERVNRRRIEAGLSWSEFLEKINE